MNFFDLAAGLVLGVSALVGWIRGAAREIAGLAAIIVAAVAAFWLLRYTGPIARHAIHTVWLANISAALLVFTAIFIVLRVIAAGLTRRIHETSALGGLDRVAGAAVGVCRALVVLGMANLTLNAIIPAEHAPPWIRNAYLYPLTSVAADRLQAFAPKGEALARQIAPAVSNAIGDGGDDEQNRAYDAAPADSGGSRVETSR